MYDDIANTDPAADRPGGITLAVYRVDETGTHVVKPRRRFATEFDCPTWPFTPLIPSDPEPPCACSPNCPYLYRK